MLACSCLIGFCRRGGDGGALSSGIFQSLIGIALHMVSFSSFSIEGKGDERVGTISDSEIGFEHSKLGIVFILRVQPSGFIFPLVHCSAVDSIVVMFSVIGMNLKLFKSTGHSAAG